MFPQPNVNIIGRNRSTGFKKCTMPSRIAHIAKSHQTSHDHRGQIGPRYPRTQNANKSHSAKCTPVHAGGRNPRRKTFFYQSQLIGQQQPCGHRPRRNRPTAVPFSDIFFFSTPVELPTSIEAACMAAGRVVRNPARKQFQLMILPFARGSDDHGARPECILMRPSRGKIAK